MKTLFLLCAASLSAQSVTPILTNPFSYPGSSAVALQLIFSDSNPPSGIQWLQFNLTLPAGVTAAACPAGVCTLGVGSQGVAAAITLSVASSASPGAAPVTVSALQASTSPTGSPTVPIALQAQNLPGNQASVALPFVIGTPGNSPWFTVTSGQTTCKTTKTGQLPLHVAYTCANQYGGVAGSYTANGPGGTAGLNLFSLGLASAGMDSVLCVIGINATAQASQISSAYAFLDVTQAPVYSFLRSGSPVTIPPNSAGYFCGTNSTNGPGNISWP